MNDLIQKYKFDLSRIDPTAIDIVKKASNGMLTALPIYINYNLMFYNKDLFDKFGVSYPVNGMTWDDTYNLAKKLTRYDNGIQYVGFSYHFLNGNMLWLNSFGQEELNPRTKKVTFDSGRWPDIMRNFLRFFEIPGHEYLIGNASLNGFAKKQRIAMQVTYSNRVIGNPDQVPPNWDIVSHPVYEDLKGIGSGIEPLYFYLSSVGKHRNEAFLAITALLEDEAQKTLAQRGFYPAVKIPDLKSAYSQVPGLKGRNVDAMFVNKFAPAVTMSQDVLAIRSTISSAVTNVMTGKKDINTALREAAEEGNKKMEERIASGQSK
ncbi:carbohydrate ABC transporter substrate-binding protein [Paenibacillus mesophilus]|uniref:extracellular solute-binding protein n=1 Tax=Paenibacillus mesophilus TaxID=2582849 RepID=UPI00110E9E11|nr:ABC transporter substrate-binding protein [Paenibacillus mesophilus]TMV48646.1 carbohydrate ABC transporter substrate-binding protein [Paenibacillus mesophilus]